jgi:hypothetical protein
MCEHRELTRARQDGKVCVSGAWTYSRWRQLGREPVPVLLALLLAALLAHSLVLLLAATPLRGHVVRACERGVREARHQLSQLPGMAWAAPARQQPLSAPREESDITIAAAPATPRGRANDEGRAHVQLQATPQQAAHSPQGSPPADDDALLAAYTRRNGTRFGLGHHH